MKYLIFMAMLCLAKTGYAGFTPLAYDDHGKRDPLTPLVSPGGVVISDDADMLVSDLILEGIVADAAGNNAAIVNGKIVKAKDNIGLYVVDSIAIDHIELLKGTESFTLKLKKGGM